MNLRSLIRKKVDPKLIAILAFFYFIATSIHLFKSTYIGYTEGKRLNWALTFFVYSLDFVVVLIYMIFIAINTKKLLIKKVPWKKIVLLHLFFSLLLGVLLQISTDLVKLGVGIIAEFDYSLQRFIHYMDLDFFTYFSMVFIIYSYYYFLTTRAGEQQKTALENQLVTAKIRMLTSQIQPHFLFNTINCIISLIETNPRKAQDTLVDLSDFFRAVTHNSKSAFITIGQELEILKLYTNILKVRFQENLTIEEEIEEAILSEQIPALSLQPLIENSVNHGYSFAKDTLHIRIKIFSQNQKIVIRVENTGELLKDGAVEFHKGVGLANTLERFRNLYNDNVTFVVQNKADNSGVENIITFPVYKPVIRQVNLSLSSSGT